MADKQVNTGISKNHKSFVLVGFSVILWALIWTAAFSYIEAVFTANYSPGFMQNLSRTFFSSTSEKQMEMIETAWNEFYTPHLLLIIFSIILPPVFIGFYIGRHSEKSKYLNTAITIGILILYKPISDVLFNFNTLDWSFLIGIFVVSFIVFPSLFSLTALGTWVGSYCRCSGGKGLYLTIYEDILRGNLKKGFAYSFISILLLIPKFEAGQKQINDVLHKYLHAFYAPVKFNSLPNDYPLVRIANTTIEQGRQNWHDSIQLTEGDSIALLLYYNNNSHLYKAVNTKLALRQDKTHLTAMLWADNAEPVQHSVELIHSCKNAQLIYENSSLPPNRSASIAIQHGNGNVRHYVLNQNAPPFNQFAVVNFNLGDIERIGLGQGDFAVTFKYNCPE